MFTVCAFLQHFEKAVHNGGILCGNITLSVSTGMEVEEVKNGRLHGINQHFTIETMFRILNSQFQYLEITMAYYLLFGRQVHDRIEKECQRAFHAIVTLRRT